LAGAGRLATFLAFVRVGRLALTTRFAATDRRRFGGRLALTGRLAAVRAPRRALARRRGSFRALFGDFFAAAGRFLAIF
jgi:hypothetical protein